MHSQINKELGLFAAWIAENPSSQLFYRLAEIYCDLERANDAIALLEKGLGFHPQHTPARLLLAELYQQQQQPAKALKHLQAAALSICEQREIFHRLAEYMPQHKTQLNKLEQDLQAVHSLLGGVSHAELPPARLNLVLDKLERLRQAAGMRYS